MSKALTERPHYRADIKNEIAELEARVSAVTSTVETLKAGDHEVRDAYKELERLRARLDLLKRIDSK